MIPKCWRNWVFTGDGWSSVVDQRVFGVPLAAFCLSFFHLGNHGSSGFLEVVFLICALFVWGEGGGLNLWIGPVFCGELFRDGKIQGHAYNVWRTMKPPRTMKLAPQQLIQLDLNESELTFCSVYVSRLYFHSRSKHYAQINYYWCFKLIFVHFKFNNTLKQQTWQFSSSRQLCNLILLFSSQSHVIWNPCFLQNIRKMSLFFGDKWKKVKYLM